ncbi:MULTISPECIES: hypothetical protein [Microbacterium]|jgi:hypothetical protein|uniref:ATP/GTP-binding protein n=1 Tax=Microbacterium paraoxydans TaxID=199592 RepID=A0ABZ2HWE2_9MICO|nr:MULTISPECIES: hypothetical protein [Microbacterium]AMG84441.1 hypothetical protein AXH82_14300 [Microbacterium sp. PAMC 28756]MPT13896.1 hypothetical protein [Microbacterium sp.]OSP00097.1 hypothetical protein B7W94_13340 [Microbacterium sp. LEMMJ01]QXE31344.1 hypothetical protein IZR02_07655 [Microbacterium paraoxydans]RUQ07977.1 hypothetical protein D8M34_01560 [Microbacterium sp. HSID17254]
MPRSRRRPSARPEGEDSFDRLLAGWKRTEVRRGVEWTVQPVSAVQAQKAYVCPGCGRSVDPGTAHLVAWRADGILGEAAALADRRHWHTPCWRIA